MPLYPSKARILVQFFHLPATSSEVQTKLNFPLIHAGLGTFQSRSKDHFSCPVISMLHNAVPDNMPAPNGSYLQRNAAVSLFPLQSALPRPVSALPGQSPGLSSAPQAWRHCGGYARSESDISHPPYARG